MTATVIKTAQKAIPDEVLEGMVAELRGNKKLFLKKAKVFRSKNADVIISARHLAEKGLLKKHKVLKEIKDANKKILGQVTNIVDTAEQLREMLVKIPEEAKESHPNLLMHLEVYLYEGTDEDEYKKREMALLDFRGLLEYHLAVFGEIQKTLISFKKQRNPNVVAMLSPFVEVLARMYEEITRKKFKVTEYGDYLSDGMVFVQKAMPLLHTPAKELHSKYEQFLASTRHTNENFHSACKYAAASIKTTGKKKDKKA